MTTSSKRMLKKKATRRGFLAGVASGVAMFHIVPAHVLGGPNRRSPNEKINVACIGVGGRGRASLDGCAGENIVALCDVDDHRARDAFKRFPDVPRYRDFRKMLDELDSKIDAVTVSTPDHTHAVAVTEALRRGKHVYCEKPLTHSVHEIRAISKLALEKDVVTQLGNQGHSFDSIRDFCETDLGRCDRRGHRDPRLLRRHPARLQPDEQAPRAGEEARGPEAPRLRPLARPGRVPGLQPSLGAVRLARLDALRQRRDRGLRLSRPRPLVLGSRSRLTHLGPGPRWIPATTRRSTRSSIRRDRRSPTASLQPTSAVR